MEKQKTSGNLISLTCRNEELYRLNICDFTEDISIGRDAECTWSVGDADTSVSSRHAIISRRKKDFYLTDLGSRNGTYCNGSRIKEIRLVPGLNIQFGECILSITAPGKQKKVKMKPHLLKYVDEKGKTVKFLLNAGTSKIGSAEKYDIFLNSALVSSPHASIHGKSDGSFWIRDLNSRNGTSVNHTELVPKTERMLKDGDIISIADVEMVYIDPAVKHNNFRLALALLTLLLTVTVCIVLYYGWRETKPSADILIQEARSEARQADFAKARDLLVSAVSAKNSDSNADSRKLLVKRIELWEHSANSWQSMKYALEQNQLAAAQQIIGNMDLRSVTAWDWNENAVKKRREAEFAKSVFAAINHLDSVLKNRDADERQLTEAIAALKKLKDQFQEYPATYMDSLKKTGVSLLLYAENTQKNLADFSKLQEQWNHSKKIDYAAELAKLEELRRSAPPVFASKLENILPMLYSMKKAWEQLALLKNLIVSMQFEECSDLKIELPQNTLSIKAIEQQLEKIRELDKQYREIAAHLEVYFNLLNTKYVSPEQDCSFLTAFQDKKKMDAVFACDTLNFAYPAKNREKAVGYYDEMVGIEYLYASLMMIKTYEDIHSRYDFSYSPVLERASYAVSIIKHFIEYAEKGAGDLLQEGKLKQYIHHLKKQLEIRDQIVAGMKTKMTAPGSREYFIAHGIIFSLDSEQYSFQKRTELYKEFAQYRTKLQKQNSEYNSALPEDAIKIREQIMKNGIPGEPVTKRMWGLR